MAEVDRDPVGIHRTSDAECSARSLNALITLFREDQRIENAGD